MLSVERPRSLMFRVTTLCLLALWEWARRLGKFLEMYLMMFVLILFFLECDDQPLSDAKAAGTVQTKYEVRVPG